jgi:hypothetical protein
MRFVTTRYELLLCGSMMLWLNLRRCRRIGEAEENRVSIDKPIMILVPAPFTGLERRVKSGRRKMRQDDGKRKHAGGRTVVKNDNMLSSRNGRFFSLRLADADWSRVFVSFPSFLIFSELSTTPSLETWKHSRTFSGFRLFLKPIHSIGNKGGRHFQEHGGVLR